MHPTATRRLGLAFLLVACTDSPVATVNQGSSKPQLDAVVVGVDSAWTFLGVDITIARDADVNAAGRPVRASALRVHLERRLQDAGWETKLLLAPTSPADLDGDAVAGISLDPHGALIGAFNRRGQSVSLDLGGQKPTSEARITALAAQFGGTLLDLRTRGPSRAFVAAPRASANSKSRAWLDQLVATSRSRERVAATLTRRYGSPVLRSGSKERYSNKQAGHTIEEVFDRGIGAVVQESVSDDIGVVVTVTKTFERLDATQYVLRSRRTQWRTDAGRTAGLTETFSNLRIEAQSQ